MNYRFASRSKNIKDSIFTDILQYLQDPEFISFSGGFPAASSFPIEGLKEAAQAVLSEEGPQALQYSATEGYYPLRKWIADRYLKRSQLHVDPDDILITTGSQQALDLIGKTFLDVHDGVVIEYPSYLGAIHSLSMFEPDFYEITLHEDGLDLEELKHVLDTHLPKLIYVVPNFHNPTGISYSKEKRLALVELIKNYDVILVEDDPYGELRYVGEDKALIKALLPTQVILMGSFSKIIAPGLRLGWVVAPKGLNQALFNAKEASDLHASGLDQRIVYHYLSHHDFDAQLDSTKQFYAIQRQAMASAMEKYFPQEVHVASSEGGMFFWVTLPQPCLAKEALDLAIQHKVIFIPGDPFYVDPKEVNTLRLNYTSASLSQIEVGIQKLGLVFNQLIHSKK